MYRLPPRGVGVGGYGKHGVRKARGGGLCGRDWERIWRQVVRQEGYADFDQGTRETAPCQQFTLIHVMCPPRAKD